jgi:hypothetical protein
VGARLWWRYAIHVVQRQQQRQHYTWAALRKVAGIRRQYVPYYLKLLQQGKQGGDATIAAWDAELDETAALLFRRMARAKYIALKQKSEGSSSGGQRPAQQQQQQTWWGWLRGSSPGAAAAATPPRSPSPALPGASGSSPGPVEPDQPLLDAGEWAALDQLLSEQEAALSKTDDDTPYTVRLRLGVVVDVAAVELQGASGVLLMQGSLDAVEGCVTSYPVTNDITLKMGMVSLGVCGLEVVGVEEVSMIVRLLPHCAWHGGLHWSTAVGCLIMCLCCPCSNAPSHQHTNMCRKMRRQLACIFSQVCRLLLKAAS